MNRLASAWVSADVKVALIDGTTYEFTIRAKPGHEVAGEINWRRDVRDSTWDEPDAMPPWRTFEPGPEAFVDFKVSGPIDGSVVRTKPAALPPADTALSASRADSSAAPQSTPTG